MGGGLVAFGHDETDDLVEGRLLDGVGFFGGKLHQRHGDVPVAAGQLEEVIGAENPGFVREAGQVLHLLVILGRISEDGKVFLDLFLDVLGLVVPHQLQEIIGRTDAAIELPFGVHGGDGAPVAVGEALDGGFRIGVFGVVGTAVAEGAGHIGDILARHVTIDVGEQPVDIAVVGDHVLAGVVGGRLVEIQDVAARTEDHKR